MITAQNIHYIISSMRQIVLNPYLKAEIISLSADSTPCLPTTVGATDMQVGNIVGSRIGQVPSNTRLVLKTASWSKDGRQKKHSVKNK